MMNEAVVTRSFQAGEIRASVSEGESENYVIEGHPAIYSEVTNIGNYFREVIEPGAFDNTNMDDVLFCVNHELRKIPLARSRRNNGNSTMHLTTDRKGLHMRAEVDVENNAEAKAVYNSIKRGDMTGMSFMFRIGEAEWENLESELPTRRIKSVSRITEVSAVNFPAYEGTDIDARDRDALDNARLALENAREPELENSRNDELEVLQLRNQILMKMED